MTRRRDDRQKSKGIETGSLENEPVFIALGRLRRPHGVKGEIMMEILTDFPERMHIGQVVHVGPDYCPMTIANLRNHKNGFLLMFEGISSRDEVSLHRNDYVCIPIDSLQPLDDDEFYYHELIGLSVYDEENNEIGHLTEILETGANNVYLVQNDDGNEVLLPAIDSVILEIRIEEQKMIVRLPEYL